MNLRKIFSSILGIFVLSMSSGCYADCNSKIFINKFSGNVYYEITNPDFYLNKYTIHSRKFDDKTDSIPAAQKIIEKYYLKVEIIKVWDELTFEAKITYDSPNKDQYLGLFTVSPKTKAITSYLSIDKLPPEESEKLLEHFFNNCFTTK